MPEYRQDPLTGRTVIVAEERASRPHQFDIEEGGSVRKPTGYDREYYRNDCPFCEKNEHLATEEVEAFRPADTRPGTPGWTVRSILNKYPAVARDDSDFPDALSFQRRFPTSPPAGANFHLLDEGYFSPIPGLGNHEVIVDTPRHVLCLSEMTEEEIDGMLRMYRCRLRSLREERRWTFVQVFKNVGAAAGASIPHAHSQLIAMPFVPPPFLAMMHRALEYRVNAAANREPTHCFWCDKLRFELDENRRIIETTSRLTALCPYVSRFTAEVEIHPIRHESRFADTDDETLAELAGLLKRTIRRLVRAVSWMKGGLAYNIVLNAEPLELPGPEYDGLFHWHFSVLPSLARAAGFEWGTGLHINPIPPESAARQLREIDLS